MDKKKVKELMEQIDFIAHDFIDGDKQEELQNLVSEVQEELSKSDWVSVEDGLPEYREDVLVKTNEDLCACYFVSSRDIEFDKLHLITYDKNDFQVADKMLHVTHWKPIEKLEE